MIRSNHPSPLLWCVINCAEKPDGRLPPIADGNTFRRLSAKYAGYHVFESRQARCESRQIGVGTKGWAETGRSIWFEIQSFESDRQNKYWNYTEWTRIEILIFRIAVEKPDMTDNKTKGQATCL